MADSNTTQEIAWYVKPSLDSVDYLKGLPVYFYENADNIKIFDNCVKIKSAGFNMIIPISDAMGGKKAWDEALAKGAGDVIQDLAVNSALGATVVGIFGTNPPGWAAAASGTIALAITWYTSATDISFGSYLEQKVAEYNHKKFTVIDLLSDQHLTMPQSLSVEDMENAIKIIYDKQTNQTTITAENVENATSILTTLYPLVDTSLSDSYFNVNITSTGEQLSIKKTISPDTQKATYTLTASDLMNASAIIDSVFGMIDISAITPSDVVVNLTDTNMSTTLTKGNLLYELGTKGSIDLYSMLGNNPWLIDESNIVLSNQHYEISGLESSIASLESALNASDVIVHENANGNNTIRGNGTTFVITDHGQIIQYDATTSKVFVVTGQYTESNYTIASSSPINDELLGSIAEALSTSSTVTLPEGFNGSIVLSSGDNHISLSSIKNSDGMVIGTEKTTQEGNVETTTQSYTDASLPTLTIVKTTGFVANYSNGAFQGFSSIDGVAVSDGFNKLFLENLQTQGKQTPSVEELQKLTYDLNDANTTGDVEAAYTATVKDAVSVTDYYGAPKLVTQTEATLQTIGTGIASLTDALSLINAIQSGNPLPIAVTGIRLAADLDYLDGVRDMPNLAAASSIASGILSIMSLSDALEKGDTIGAVTAGANALYFSATGYAVLSSSSTEVAKALSSTFGDTASTAIGSLGKALPYLNMINSIAKGDYVGVAVAVVDAIMIDAAIYTVPYVGWAYAVYSIVKSLFGGHDDIPDPWGNGQYLWNGNSITYQSAGQTGGKEAVNTVMNSVLSVLNNLIEQERQTNPTSALGIIPNRMPTIAYDMSGYRYTDIDPLSGEEKHAYLRFDTSGNPYNATPGSTESYQSIIEAMVRSSLTRSAIAPLWEVQTAKMQILFTCKSFSNQKALHVKNQMVA